MSWFKQVFGGPRGSGGGAAGGSDRGGGGGGGKGTGVLKRYRNDASEISLELAELRTRFFDYEMSEDQNGLLKDLLARFCKVFATVDAADVEPQFGSEAFQSFVIHVSKNLVKEIRDRATNQSTEAASKAIVGFLCQPDGTGPLLLRTVRILVGVPGGVIKGMVSMSLPSTLVKALYLFYDLPPVDPEDADASPPAPAPEAGAASPALSRKGLQATMVQLLRRLCGNTQGIQELLRSDDLFRLFDLLATPCPEYNKAWRDSAAEALNSVYTSCFSPDVVAYIKAKGCIGRCLAALQQDKDEFSPREIVSIVASISACLKNSAPISSTLLEDFRASHGYPFLTEVLLSVEEAWISSGHETELSTFVAAVKELVTVGRAQLKPAADALNLGSQDRGFQLPRPMNTDLTARNLPAFHILHSVVLKASGDLLRSLAMDAVFEVYATDPANYFLLASLRTLPLFIEGVEGLSRDLQERVLKLLEFVVCTLNFVPVAELTTLAKKLHSDSSEVICLCLRTIIKFINFDAKFADVSRTVGILDTLIAKLLTHAQMLKEQQSPNLPPAFEHLEMSASDCARLKESDEDFFFMECITLMLSDNPPNADVFRNAGGSRAVFNMVPLTESRHHALRVIQQLILSDDSRKSHDDLSTLLEVMQSTPPSAYGVKIDIIKAILRLFSFSAEVKNWFRDVHGFVYVISSLVALSDASSESPMFPSGRRESLSDGDAETKLLLVKTIFECLSAALKNHSVNQQHFRTEVRYDMLADSIKLSGVLKESHALEVMGYLLAMACESFGHEHEEDGQRDIVNPDVLKVIVALLPITGAPCRQRTLDHLSRLAQVERNAQNMATAQVTGLLLDRFADVLRDLAHPLYSTVLGLVKHLGSCHIGPAELRTFLRFNEPNAAEAARERVPIEHLRALVAMTTDVHAHLDAPFFEFDMSRKGFSCLYAPALARLARPGFTAERVWPPPAGFTVSVWVRVLDFGRADHPVRIMTVFAHGEPEQQFLSIEVDPQYFVLLVKTAEVARFQRHRLLSNRWYHVAVSFAGKPRMKAGLVTLFLDGAQMETAKLPYPGTAPHAANLSDVNSLACLRFGTGAQQRRESFLKWRMGPFHFVNEVLSAQAIEVMHQLGPGYSANFQGPLHRWLPWSHSEATSSKAVTKEKDPQRGAPQAGKSATGKPVPVSTAVVRRHGVIDLSTVPSPLFPEDSIWCAFHAHSECLVKVEDALLPMGGRIALRALGQETGCKELASLLLSFRNSAPGQPAYAHAVGRARAFCPSGVAHTVDQIGGVPVIFKMVADAMTTDYLRTAIELLVLVTKQCARNAREIERLNGYQVLGGILSLKSHIMNRDILDLLLTLTWPDREGVHDMTVIVNPAAFKELIFEHEVWKHASVDLHKLVLQHILRLVTSQQHSEGNVKLLRQLRITQKYLFVLGEDGTPPPMAAEIVSVLTALYKASMTVGDVKKIALFLLATLERHLMIQDKKEYTASEGGDASPPRAIRNRNLLLTLLLDLLADRQSRATVTELVIKTLGADWFLVFLEASVCDETVLLASRIICSLLSDPSGLFAAKFRSSSGFVMLAELLPAHCHLHELYFLVIAVILGKPMEEVPLKISFTLAHLHELFQFKLADTIGIVRPEMIPVALALLQRLHARHYLESIGAISPTTDSLDTTLDDSGVQSDTLSRDSPTSVRRASTSTSADAPASQPAPVPDRRSNREMLAAIQSMVGSTSSVTTPKAATAPAGVDLGPGLAGVSETDPQLSPGTERAASTTPAPDEGEGGEEATPRKQAPNPFGGEPSLGKSSKPANPFAAPPKAAGPTKAKNPFAPAAAPDKPSNPFASKATTPAAAKAVPKAPTSPAAPDADTAKAKIKWQSPWPTAKPVPRKAKGPNPFTGPGTRSATQPTEVPEDPFGICGDDWLADFPATLVKYLVFLYRKSSEFATHLLKPENLDMLVLVLFAPGDGEMELDGSLLDTSAMALHYNPGQDTVKRARVKNHVFIGEHPNAPTVLSFLRMLVVDSLGRKDQGTAVLEAILESAPSAQKSEVGRFQFELFKATLIHFITSKSLSTGGSTSSILVPNIGRLCASIAERVASGTWVAGQLTMWQHMVQLLRQAVDESGAVYTFALTAFGAAVLQPVIDTLFKSLNRTTLFLLSHDSVAANRLAIVDSVANTMPLLLGEVNIDTDYLCCLCHQMLRLVETRDEGLVAAGVRLCRAILQKRPAQMKVLMGKTFDPHRKADAQVVEALLDARAILKPACTKAWAAKDAHEAKAAALGPRASRRNSRLTKKDKRERVDGLATREMRTRASEQISNAHQQMQLRISRRRHRLVDNRRFVSAEWQQMEHDLYRERGLFGPDKPSHLDKWMLDNIEGPSRKHLRLRPNPNFYQDYPYDPERHDGGPDDHHKHRKQAPTSAHSKEYYSTYIRPAELCADLDETITADGPGADPLAQLAQAPGSGGEEAPLSSRAKLQRLMRRTSSSSFGGDSLMSTSSYSLMRLKTSTVSLGDFSELALLQDDNAADQGEPAVLRLLEPGDDIKMKQELSLVSGLDAYEGVFFLCEWNAYFLEGYGISGHGSIYHRKQEVWSGDPLSKWCFEDIKDVRKARYLLRDVALEIYSVDGKNSLLAFNDRPSRDAVYNNLLQLATTLTETAEESVAGMRRDAKVERDGFFNFSLTRGPSVTQRWESGELTNFQYLMYLNTLAGRSYNDLNQYPVMPWVLRDYQSAALDLADPATFRDFSKPMGAQTEKRAEGFRFRYDNWEDVLNEGTPPFHYGTHYSSAAIVSSFLIRVEPFTKLFLKVQGGHFDHPDRMFHSIGEAWASASEKNNGDVKELIPEFFYLPDFLTNTNAFELGTKQNGVTLNDVILPPWAKDDPHEFVRLHREALESDYVSEHLHEWIDLIFGFKQQGEEARRSLNVFHHMTYEGAVDIDALTEQERTVALSIINNFGQTPKQLFKRPHPRKRLKSRDDAAILSTKHQLNRLVCAAHPVKDIGVAVGEIIGTEKLIVASTGQLLVPPLYQRCLDWNSPEQSLIGFSLDTEKDVSFYEGLHIGSITCAVTLSNRMLITGGQDSTVRVWQTQTLKARHSVRSLSLKQALYGHLGAVTCLALSTSYNVMVSGSDDQSCIIWDLTRLRYVRQLAKLGGSVSALCMSKDTGNIVACARDLIFLWTINGEPLARIASLRSSGSPITCCAISEISEWADDGLIVTGHQDGRVKLWKASFSRRKRARAASAATAASPGRPGLEPEAAAAAADGSGAPAVAADAEAGDGWERQIELAYVLPVHSIVADPAPATALCIADNQRKLYVGDQRGCVYAWGFPEGSGRSSDVHWVKDNSVGSCMACSIKFSFAERKHHCRNCGKVFCHRCSSQERPVESLGLVKPVRVCDKCCSAIDAALAET